MHRSRKPIDDIDEGEPLSCAQPTDCRVATTYQKGGYNCHDARDNGNLKAIDHAASPMNLSDFDGSGTVSKQSLLRADHFMSGKVISALLGRSMSLQRVRSSPR